MKKLVSLLVLVGLIVGVTLAVRHLPWWALVLLFVALVWGGKWLVGRFLKKLILTPFKMKGAVLHDATVRVHSVVPTVAPTRSSDDDEADRTPSEPRRYFTAEVTIEPKEATGNFSHWEPGELRLCRPEHTFDPNDEDSKTDDDACDVVELWVEQDGVFQKDEGLKFPGPQKLKMTLAVAEGVQALKFQYYFEAFGRVELPSANATAAAA
ncbi:MAG: hypothetical protein L0Y58_08825 [Verrucomicrobia subdivision 3 bacterium]|nr:hypothetical protein [Limisphaerales bacterium]